MEPNRRPLMTIGTLLTTASLIVATIASGVALAVGSLPREFEVWAQHLALVGPIGAAVAIGLGAIGKGLYEIGARERATEPEGGTHGSTGLPPAERQIRPASPHRR